MSPFVVCMTSSSLQREGFVPFNSSYHLTSHGLGGTMATARRPSVPQTTTPEIITHTPPFLKTGAVTNTASFMAAMQRFHRTRTVNCCCTAIGQHAGQYFSQADASIAA